MRSFVDRVVWWEIRSTKKQMSLLDIGPVIFGSKEGLIDNLRRYDLLVDHCNCARCGVPMRARPSTDVSVGDAHNAHPGRAFRIMVYSPSPG